MDQIKQQLSTAFVGFSHVEDGNKVTVRYPWNIAIDGVACVRVMLSGKNSLTGEPIEDVEIARLSPTNTNASRSLPYDGLFFLHFDALDRNGQVLVKDFRKKQVIKLLNPAKCASVKHSVQPAKRGWSKLVLDTNCPKRCLNKLWVFFDDHYQLVPPMQSGVNVFYLPTTSKNIRLYFDEADSEELQPINC